MNVEDLRKKYPKGTVLVLDFMDDVWAPPFGTHGTVEFIDDAGQIHMHWDNGSGLALIPDVDYFHIFRG